MGRQGSCLQVTTEGHGGLTPHPFLPPSLLTTPSDFADSYPIHSVTACLVLPNYPPDTTHHPPFAPLWSVPQPPSTAASAVTRPPFSCPPIRAPGRPSPWGTPSPSPLLPSLGLSSSAWPAQARPAAPSAALGVESAARLGFRVAVRRPAGNASSMVRSSLGSRPGGVGLLSATERRGWGKTDGGHGTQGSGAGKGHWAHNPTPHPTTSHGPTTGTRPMGGHQM